MLIARVTPILQVTHARGGQYKYYGHTISFPQDISTIAPLLSPRLQDIEVLIICRTNLEGKNYNFYVNKNVVLDALNYKLKYDPYYKDVVFDVDTLNQLPDTTTDISNLLHNLTITSHDTTTTNETTSTPIDEIDYYNTSSFIP